MTRKTKNDDVISISKNKLFKIIGIVVGVIALFGICFAISVSNSEEYKESAVDKSEDSDDEDVLAAITKEAGEVSDEERTAPEEISLEEYLEMNQKKEQSLVLLSRPTCQYCKIATPIIENLIYQYHVPINYLNTDNLSREDQSTLMASNEYFSDGYGTPLLLVVGDGKVVDSIEGLVRKNDYISFFKKYGFME